MSIFSGNSSKLNYIDAWSFQMAILTTKKNIIIQIDVVTMPYTLHSKNKLVLQLIFARFFFICFQVSECDIQRNISTWWIKRFNTSTHCGIWHFIERMKFLCLAYRGSIFCVCSSYISLFSVSTMWRIKIEIVHLIGDSQFSFECCWQVKLHTATLYCSLVAILMGDKLYLDVNMTVISD